MIDAPSLVAALRAAHAAGAPTPPLGDVEPAVLAEAALLLLETLDDADGSLDMWAAGVLLDHGEGRHLDRLRAVRPHLRPRVALRDWRREVDRVIAALSARGGGACDCAAEAAHGAPVYGERWEVESEVPGDHQTTLQVRCRLCGRGWRVVSDDSYHYPTFDWTPRTTRPPAR